MNLALTVDLLFLFIAVILSVKGFIKGFTSELISLVATFGGVIVAFRMAPAGGSIVKEIFEDITPTAAQIVSMVVVFVVIVLLGALLNKVMKAFLSVTSLTFMDRVLGALAGMVKATVILMVAYVLLSLAKPMTPPEFWKYSKSMNVASLIWPKVSPYVMKNDFIRSEIGELQ